MQPAGAQLLAQRAQVDVVGAQHQHVLLAQRRAGGVEVLGRGTRGQPHRAGFGVAQLLGHLAAAAHEYQRHLERAVPLVARGAGTDDDGVGLGAQGGEDAVVGVVVDRAAAVVGAGPGAVEGTDHVDTQPGAPRRLVELGELGVVELAGALGTHQDVHVHLITQYMTPNGSSA